VIDRRRLLAGALGAALAASTVGATSVRNATTPDAAEPTRPAARQSTGSTTFDAVAFDGFVIFDPRPIAVLAESLAPGRGTALVDVLRTRQFEYQWLRALGGRYADFMQTTEAALDFAAAQIAIDLDRSARQRLLDAYTNLSMWPDVPGSLKALRDSGMRLAMLSNMSHAMLADGLARGGIGSLVEVVLSTESIATYKPDPRAYRLGVDALGVPKERILFVAFAAWDVAGAKWFGYPTFWTNRLHAQPEQLGVAADAAGADLESLVRFATSPDR
jgi:2-haloacid dehalogenase